MNLAHVVVDAGNFQPFGLRCDHAPRRQVIKCSTPEHSFFTTGIHGNIATNARGLGRGGVNRKHKTTALSRIRHTLGNHTCLSPHRSHGLLHAGQQLHFDLGHGLQLFGVNDHAFPSEWHRAAGVTSTTPTRHNRQAQVNTAFNQTRHFFF